MFHGLSCPGNFSFLYHARDWWSHWCAKLEVLLCFEVSRDLGNHSDKIFLYSNFSRFDRNLNCFHVDNILSFPCMVCMQLNLMLTQQEVRTNPRAVLSAHRKM